MVGERTTGKGEVGHQSGITLDILAAVHQDSALTQRKLSKELGIALGLTNAYLKRCVRKGLIKVKQAPPNRYAYYLTPKGFTEKGRLTARYLARSFQFYGEARSQLDQAFDTCAAHGWRQAVLVGTGELAEIAILCAMRYPVEIVGIVDGASRPGKFMHVRLEPNLEALGQFDAVIVTDREAPQLRYDSLAGSIPPERILTPSLLMIARGGLGGEAAS